MVNREGLYHTSASLTLVDDDGNDDSNDDSVSDGGAHASHIYLRSIEH